MSVFRKIFGSISKSDKEHQKNKDEDKFLPKKDTPIDESFTINFNENGGKFLYSENINEVYVFLQKILEENNWKEKPALVLNSDLKKNSKTLTGILSKSLTRAIFYLLLVSISFQMMVLF